MSARLPAKDKLVIVSSMSTMLSAGIPILEAVEALLADSKKQTKKFLMLLQQNLNEGKQISAAMEASPQSFDGVTVSLVRAGEEAGTLESVLQDLEKSIKEEMAFRDKLRASMLYPLFIMMVFFGVLLVILGFVIPRVSKVFLGLKLQLPPITQLMIGASSGLFNYWPYIIGVIIALICAGVLIYRAKRQAVINGFLKLPLLKRLGWQIDMSRLCRSLALQLKAGVPISEALLLTKAVVNKKEAIQLVERMSEAVSNGKPLSEGVQPVAGAISQLTIRIIKTGEQSGTLEKTMQELAEYYENQVSHTLSTISTLIEPVLIVVIGLLVGGMMLAIIAPMYNLIGQIQTR